MASPDEQAEAPAEGTAGPAPATGLPSETTGPAGGPERRGRGGSGLQRFFVRLVATGGVIGIGTAVGAILAANKVQGWIIGLVVALVSVLLAAVLWSSKQI
jgi:hypothetical protein